MFNKSQSLTPYFLLPLFAFLLIFTGCGGNTITKNSKNTNQKKPSAKIDYSWITMNLPWKGTFKMPFMGETHSKESEKPEINLAPNSPYTTYTTLGSSELLIFNVVAIRSDGTVIAAYKSANTYQTYQKKFKLSPEEVAAFTKVLIKAKAGSMVASSIDPEEKNGVQGGFTIIAHGTTRRSYFSNSWPNSFQTIADYISKNILKYSINQKDNGFLPVNKSILTIDPEATLAIRGLINGK